MGTMVITPPINNGWLPGRDNNIYSFYSTSTASSTDETYYYLVQVKSGNTVISTIKINQVLTYEGGHLAVGSDPKINIRNIIAPYFNEVFNNNSAEIISQIHTNVLEISIVVSGYVINTTTGEPEAVADDTATSPNIYYYDGCTFDFWNELYNYNTILSYQPTGNTFPSDRPNWVGPMKPKTSSNYYLPGSAGGMIPEYEMYDIHVNSYRTATSVLDNDSAYFNNCYRVNVYDKDGRMTKFGTADLTSLLPDLNSRGSKFQKFKTFPVGVPQINTLASATFEDGKIYFQLTAHGVSIGSAKYIDDKDEYYQIMLWNRNQAYNNQANSTVPLNFHILRGPDPLGELNFVDIVYYSKLGGWWAIPAYKRNYKTVDINTISNTLNNNRLRNTTYRDAQTVHISAEDTFVVNTDWVSGGEIFEVEDMIQSPMIYLCKGGINIPVHLVNSSYTVDASNKRVLRSYTFNFATDYIKNTIK